MSVLLKKPIFDTVSNSELVEQIEAKKKCKKKLPTWFKNARIYYPKKLNIEQTSSEITANYKSQIVSGKSLIDLTGGFGVDSLFLSKKIDTVFHCEIDENLSEIAGHNFKVMGVKNIETFPEDGISFLRRNTARFDWLFIDPSRRTNLKGKVFQLSHCLPDVTAHLDLFFRKSDAILIKTAPLLDITKGISELKKVREVHILAVANDVKEILWVLSKSANGSIEVKTRNFQKDFEQDFNFIFSDEKQLVSNFSEPLTYLYEPNAAIMKSGGFKVLGKKYDLQKLHPNTQLYTGDQLMDFPGRRFLVEAVVPYSSKKIKQLDIKKANITVRNFPLSVAEIRKKHKILDGGAQYLFFTSTQQRKRVLIRAHKV